MNACALPYVHTYLKFTKFNGVVINIVGLSVLKTRAGLVDTSSHGSFCTWPPCTLSHSKWLCNIKSFIHSYIAIYICTYACYMHICNLSWLSMYAQLILKYIYYIPSQHIYTQHSTDLATYVAFKSLTDLSGLGTKTSNIAVDIIGLCYGIFFIYVVINYYTTYSSILHITVQLVSDIIIQAITEIQ